MEARYRSTVTLIALAVVLVIMAVVGWKSATTAFPSLGPAKQTPAPCAHPVVKKVLYRKEVTVSVFNASKKAGLAQRTMRSMQNRHFTAGAVGNAPAGLGVSRVKVFSTTKDDPRAKLVAMQFKPVAQVGYTTEDLGGAGVDLVLGPKAPRPVVPAPRSITLDKPITTCADGS